jgi:hypothetical protein
LRWRWRGRGRGGRRRGRGDERGARSASVGSAVGVGGVVVSDRVREQCAGL